MKLTDYCSQYYANKVRVLRNAGLTALLAVVTQQATAANVYFDVNGSSTSPSAFGVTTGSTYSWDSAFWSTSSTGVAATANWVAGNFARFDNTSSAATAYTVNVGADESMAGAYVQQTGVTVTINQTPSTSGDLNVVTGVQGFLMNGSASSLIINAPIVGLGGIENQSGGSLFLYGNNTYQGGTLLDTSGGVNFNSSSSFGTGPIGWATSQQVIADPIATGPINLPNAMNTRAASQLIVVSGAGAPVTSSGAWTLSAVGTTSTLTGGGSVATPTSFTISGKISGAGNLAFTSLSPTYTPTFTLSGSGNNYTGTTAATGVNLLLSSANAAGASTGMTLSGATLAVSGTQTMGSAPLTMTASSSIAFDVGGSATAFANSATSAWTGVLNLTSWDPTIDSLRFGTDATGLTTAQLTDIEFDGVAGEAAIDGGGYIHAVPEPTTLALGVMGAFGFLARRKKA